MVLQFIKMNPPQVYMCSPSWTLLPPHTIPVGRPSAPAPSIQYHASNLDWWLVSYMILYMFQCHSPKSSHLLPLPQSPKDCSIHQCLFCCLVYRVIVTIFLNSIYMCWYTVLLFFFLAYFNLYNRLQFNPPHYNWFKCFLFDGWVILYCVYVPQLSYPFICWWTSRVLPCPGYYKQCCNEHWGTRVSFNSGFLCVYAQQWDCWIIRQFYFQFFKESSHCSP